MPLERGAVYRRILYLPAWPGGPLRPLLKYMVVLQDPRSMDPNATNFAFVIASTDRTGRGGRRVFEARLDESDGFDHSTIVDGRWVYTEPRDVLDEDDYQWTLSEERMDEVSLAVYEGLQLQP